MMLPLILFFLLIIELIKGCPLHHDPQYDQRGTIKFCAKDSDCHAPLYLCIVSPIGEMVCCTPKHYALFSNYYGPVKPRGADQKTVRSVSTQIQVVKSEKATPASVQHQPPEVPPPQPITFLVIATAPPAPPSTSTSESTSTTEADTTTTTTAASTDETTETETTTTTTTTTTTPNLLNIVDGGQPYVRQLVSGKYTTTTQNTTLFRSGSVTLICDGSAKIIVDTGLPCYRNLVASAIQQQGVSLSNVALVVNTNGQVDHTGNQNLFPSALFLTYDFLVRGEEFLTVDYQESEPLKLSNAVDVYRTPGHTPRDLTVVVKTQDMGIVSVTGDLFYSLADDGIWQLYSNDVDVQESNRNFILCFSDWIIPGHGEAFQITEEMKDNAGCDSYLKPSELVTYNVADTYRVNPREYALVKLYESKVKYLNDLLYSRRAYGYQDPVFNQAYATKYVNVGRTQKKH